MTHTTDQTVLGHIEHLVAEEKKLYAKGGISEAEKKQLDQINVELDRAGISCVSVAPCASSAAIPTRPRCGPPISSKTTAANAPRTELSSATPAAS